MAPRQQGGNTRRIGELDRRLDAAGRIRTRLAVLLDSAGATDGRLSDELLTLLEEMTMLDTTAQRRITLLVYADIAAAHDWLVRVFGLGPASVAVMVDDVDAHYRHATSEGATIVYEPVDQPYGYRVYSAHDLEGHLWSFMKPFA